MPNNKKASATVNAAGNTPIDEQIKEMIRVNHAGEFGAKRIYEGQLAALKNSPSYPEIKHMMEQELVHLARFEQLAAERRVRPTALMPIWNIAGFALGYITGKLGERAAMACTVAVEEVIDKHYSEQLEKLPDTESQLKADIEKFRAEELEHRDIGLEKEAEKTPFFPVISAIVTTASKAAIAISKKI